MTNNPSGLLWTLLSWCMIVYVHSLQPDLQRKKSPVFSKALVFLWLSSSPGRHRLRFLEHSLAGRWTLWQPSTNFLKYHQPFFRPSSDSHHSHTSICWGTWTPNHCHVVRRPSLCKAGAAPPSGASSPNLAPDSGSYPDLIKCALPHCCPYGMGRQVDVLIFPDSGVRQCPDTKIIVKLYRKSSERSEHRREPPLTLWQVRGLVQVSPS